MPDLPPIPPAPSILEMDPKIEAVRPITLEEGYMDCSIQTGIPYSLHQGMRNEAGSEQSVKKDLSSDLSMDSLPEDTPLFDRGPDGKSNPHSQL